MFFPVQECESERALVPNSELRLLNSIASRFGLFGFEQSYLQKVDDNLTEVLCAKA
jgi:homoserine O-acetyltransferase/O-succinyltransferase